MLREPTELGSLEELWTLPPPLSMTVAGGGTAYQKFLGSKEHLDWLKIDSNVAKIIPIQNY